MLFSPSLNEIRRGLFIGPQAMAHSGRGADF
jgi:hypothetical protein